MFFAKLLHHFIKENTNCQNMMINYVLAIRTEYDLFNINEEYRTIYNADLIDDLQVHSILYSSSYTLKITIRKLILEFTGTF